jgi:hypothetical protein
MYLLTYYELYVNDWPPMADGQGKRSNWHDLYDSVDLVICEYQQEALLQLRSLYRSPSRYRDTVEGLM